MAGRPINYETLPCIDSSGRDVFETGGDVAPEHKGSEQDELLSESVDHYKINQGQAFESFQDKYLDTPDIDFSDRLSAQKRIGYETKTVYEIIGEKIAKETPQQKYQRLQHELRELAEEMEQIKSNVTDAEKEAKLSPANLAGEVRQLQSQLQHLQLEKILGTESLAADGVPHGSWTRQIMSQLEAFKAKEKGKSLEEKYINLADCNYFLVKCLVPSVYFLDKVIYELYYEPEHARFAQAAKASVLEQRLAKLETIVGKDNQKMTAVTAEPEGNPTTLMDSVAVLRGKLSLLDPNNVDIVDARVQGLLHHINQALSKKEAIAAAEQQSKINELYELCQKWDCIADVVPDLVKRLKALQGLHAQASKFLESLTLLETAQNQVKGSLQSQKATMEKLEKTLVENGESIKANCTSLDARITSLVAKLEG